MSVDPYNGMDSAALAKLIEESFGFKMRELEAKIGISADELDSRWDIAQLQAGTSRYGVDQQAKTDRMRIELMKAEMERVAIPDMLIRKYVAEKNYEIARSELSFKIAATAAELASSPDTFLMAKDFYDSLGTLQAGGKLPTFGAPTGTPQMKSLSDLTNQLASDDPLAAAGQLVGAAGPAANIDWSAYTGQTGTIVPNLAGTSGTSGTSTPSTSTAGATTDPRLAAVQSVVQATPPSVGNGYTDADIQALQSISSIYQQGLAGLPPQTLESMSEGDLKMFLAGGARAGYYNPDELQQYMRSRIYQGDSVAAA